MNSFRPYDQKSFIREKPSARHVPLRMFHPEIWVNGSVEDHLQMLRWAVHVVGPYRDYAVVRRPNISSQARTLKFKPDFSISFITECPIRRLMKTVLKLFAKRKVCINPYFCQGYRQFNSTFVVSWDHNPQGFPYLGLGVEMASPKTQLVISGWPWWLPSTYTTLF